RHRRPGPAANLGPSLPRRSQPVRTRPRPRAQPGEGLRRGAPGHGRGAERAGPRVNFYGSASPYTVVTVAKAVGKVGRRLMDRGDFQPCITDILGTALLRPLWCVACRG